MPRHRATLKSDISSINEVFATRYSRHHVDLLRYVLTLVPDRAQAEDIVQETARALWQKAADYDPGQPFLPWARKFAYLEVLKARRREGIKRKFFSDALVETLAEERPAADEFFQARREALGGCLAKLDDSARQLLSDRYANHGNITDIAARRRATPNSLYITLHRIRLRLLECIERSLKGERVL
jgi:RNA polymerase sigma-70 factor (ECF subfamily)